jgi:lipopolysaccharide transport system ATP-binding protein
LKDIVISIKGLSKRYRLGVINHGMLYKDFQSWRARRRNRPDPHGKVEDHPVSEESDKEFIWALKDISFDVNRGDRVGIIGRNGAGKSTLLKILSRITAPTEGEVRIRGRVGSLLEVGTGFHPELTGRENVFLNGAILGMKKPEIAKKMDEIISFAEVERFADTPVKRYSSGMHVRLAFSVAAHLEPEILVVDEVLAVGDIAFQKKCLNKMKGVSKRDGRTVIFVSHNLAAVASLCNRGIVLENGVMAFSGDSADAIVKYTEQMRIWDSLADQAVSAGKTRVQLLSARLSDSRGKAVTSIHMGQEVNVEMRYIVRGKVKDVLVPNLHVKTEHGAYAFISNAGKMTTPEQGEYVARCRIPGNLLNQGIYTIGVAVTEQDCITIAVTEDIHNNPNRYGYGRTIPGVVRPLLDWSVNRINGVS